VKITRPLATALCAPILLSSCASGRSTAKDSVTGTPSIAPPVSSPQAVSTPEDNGTAATVLRSGFGIAQGGYAWVTSIVRNDSQRSGQTVTVHFNLKSAAGDLVASGDQVEAFSRPGQLLAAGTQVTIPAGTKPATLEATAQVEYPGIGSQDAFPEIPFGPVTVQAGQFGGYQAKAILHNPTSTALKSPRVGVVCYGPSGTVIGGTSEFPDLVPPSGDTLVATNNLEVSGRPTRCEMYAGPGA